MIRVAFQTTVGDFMVELYREHAAQTCDDFVQLMQSKYYNDSYIHRIVQDYVLQGGMRLQDIAQDSDEFREKIESFHLGQISRDLKHTGAGVFGLVRDETTGKFTGQFYITLAPTPSLDRKQVIIGRVCEGMKVVKKLSLLQTDVNDVPVEEVRIISATIYYQDTDEP
ncbi:hypothetical protein MP228_005135 [Amoeboaphelidium protococcarum]|nr:hypothetical protein MP228_005135 [Amoeboaphelidium protococcarum]